VYVPLMMRIALSQELGTAFSWTFIRDYIGRMWWPTVKAELFLLFGSTVVTALGLLLCFVGIYPASALTIMARYHVLCQLYEMYLARGGMTIPLKEEVPTVPRWESG